MTNRFSARLIAVSVLSLLTLQMSPLSAKPSSGNSGEVRVSERARLAQALLKSRRVSLLRYHVSGNEDRATAYHNLVQTAKSLPARRSYYGNAPGGTTKLGLQMLRALYRLQREGYTFRITELAGGSHSSRSRHYVGVAFDIDMLNGKKIRPGHPTYRRFMQRCRELGATEVLGPGSRGHTSHVHVAWPRF